MARDSGSGLPSGGSDIVTVELTAAEAASGTTKTIALPPDGRLIAINLPAGIGDGAILRLPRNDAASTDGPPELTIHVQVTSDDPTSVIPLPTPYDQTKPIAVPATGDDEKTTVLPTGQDRTAVVPAPDSDADERTTVIATDGGATPPALADEDRTAVISTGTPTAADEDRTTVIPAGATPPAPAVAETPASATTADDDRTTDIPTRTTPAAADGDRTTVIPATDPASTPATTADDDRTTVIPAPATASGAGGDGPATTGVASDEDRTAVIPTGATPAGPAGESPASATTADHDRTTVLPAAAEQTSSPAEEKASPTAEEKAEEGDRTGSGIAPATLAAGAAGAVAGAAAGAAAASSARPDDTAAQPATPFNAETTQHVPADATSAPADAAPVPAAADATPPGYTLPGGTAPDTASEAAGAAIPPTSGAPSTAYPPTPAPGYTPAPGAPAQSYPPVPGTPGYPPVSGAPAQSYPPAPGTPGYPPVSGAPAGGYQPVSGGPAQSYPPAPGYPPVSGGPAAPGYPASGVPGSGAPAGYPPVPGTPGYPQTPNTAGAPGYPPPGTPGYPTSGVPAPGYPTSGVPASGVPGAQAWGQPPQSGAPAWGQPGAYPLGAPGGYAVPPQQKPKRSTGLIVGAAVLVVLLCAGVVAVPWLLNSGEPDPDPTGGGPGPAATTQAPVAMTPGQYQAVLSALDGDVQPAWDAMNRATKPDALSSAADDLGEMLGLQADELARVTPPEDVADEHNLLVEALNALSTDVLDASLSAEGSALCTGSSAVNLVSRSDGGADLRDAATALSSADLKVGGWMPKALKEESRRPPNGNYYRRIQGGLGELKVDNGGDHDALINLVKNGQTRPEVSFYVQAKSNFTASSIHDGAYTIYVTTGTDFDGTRFNRDCDFSKFDEAITYETTNNQYTIWEISLEASVGGNASTSDVPPGSFPE
ncbi:hypothetical protein J2S43_004775 [Catenuloplanes nepalensis]|uniref:Uncharacterized protein n=1 Tax=Catenuloplanes nepalensis TaxID=587533 RepID=A0ABT9MYC9_9ACTN|nr:hypothetical protein [Catenuloplanes nepalensis]MDP9796263.1 hypothetical protein [Catenuloplanes nepalensis]